MKYLSHYTEAAQTELFEKMGAFFAFSQAQFERKRKEGVEYVSITAGLIAPKENAEALVAGLEDITAAGIQQDIAENGIDAIIKRELHNHECFYTGDISDAVDALADYGITRQQVVDGYRKNRKEAEAFN